MDSAPRLFENGRLRAASSGTAGRGRRAVPQSAEGCPRTATALRRRYAPIGEPDAGIHSATDENASLPQGFGSGSAAGRPVDAAPPGSAAARPADVAPPGSSAAGLRPGSIALPGRSGAPEPRRARCTHRPRGPVPAPKGAPPSATLRRATLRNRSGAGIRRPKSALKALSGRIAAKKEGRQTVAPSLDQEKA